MSQFLKTKEEIVAWLDEKEIANYKINDDLTVDVNGDIYLDRKLGTDTQLPVQFGVCNGFFSVSENRLTSLKGSPRTVKEGMSCMSNLIVSLEGAPQTIGGDFYCMINQITTLKGGPKKVDGNYACGDNPLISLKGAPHEATNFFCAHAKLKSLEGCPTFIENRLDARENQLETVTYLPKQVGKLDLRSNKKIPDFEHCESLLDIKRAKVEIDFRAQAFNDKPSY